MIVELDVLKNNEKALKMYQGFGFEIIGTRENALRYQYAHRLFLFPKVYSHDTTSLFFGERLRS